MPQRDAVQIGDDGDQIGPQPIEATSQQHKQYHLGQAQRLLVDLFQRHGFVFDELGGIDILLLLELFATRHGSTMRQAAGGYRQTTDRGLLDDAPGHEQVEGIDEAVGQLQGRVVVTEHHQHDEGNRGQGQRGRTEPLQQIILFAQVAAGAKQRVNQEQGDAQHGQGHHLANHVIGEAGRVQLTQGGDDDERDERAPDILEGPIFAGSFARILVEVALGHATGAQNFQQHGKRHVGGGKAQGEEPDHLGFTQTTEQEQEAHGHDQQGARQHLQAGEQQCLGGVQVGIPVQTADVLAQGLDFVAQELAFPA